MALIARFEHRPLEPRGVHGEVLCGYKVVQFGKRRILQLETYGSPERKVPGGATQKVQLDEAAARKLVSILRSAFPRIE